MIIAITTPKVATPTSPRPPVAILLLIALLGLASPAEAAPAPIVFDFEDGLQGWELQGAATRVQTQLLGGEWAIFGDGLVGGFDLDGMALISVEADLTEVVTISVDQLLLLNLPVVLIDIIRRPDGLIGHMSGRLGVPFEQDANPGTWSFDVSNLVGLHEIALLWTPVLCSVPDCTLDPATAASFIDNITFHPVPEPGTLGLLAGSLVALVIARRRMM